MPKSNWTTLFSNIAGPMAVSALAGISDSYLEKWVKKYPTLHEISKNESLSTSLGALLLSIYYFSTNSGTRKKILPYLIALAATGSYRTGNKIGKYTKGYVDSETLPYKKPDNKLPDYQAG